MATVVLQTIGYAFGGPIGGAIGAVVGGLIDQELFGPDDQDGPRLEDLGITTSSYGKGIPLIYGPGNRVSGNVIWATDLIESSREEGGKGGGPTLTTYSYKVSVAVGLAGRQMNGTLGIKRIWANKKVIYDIAADTEAGFSPDHEAPAVDPVNGQIVERSYIDPNTGTNQFRGSHFIFEDLRFYPGSSVQIPDPVIESFEGVGNVPSYRHHAYAILTDLQLADFGNRIPTFEFELQADDSITVGDILLDLTARAGLTNVSVQGLTDSVRGYALARQTSITMGVLALEINFGFDSTEQHGQIRFIKRSLGMKGTIELEDMNARVPFSSSKELSPITYKNKTEIVMPDIVSITFKDPAMDYQINTQTAFRRTGSAINKVSQDIPLVMSEDEARRLADKLLWGAWAHKLGVRYRVDDRWARISPADILGIPAYGETLPMRVIRITRGNNGIIEMEASYDDPEINNSLALGVAGPVSSGTVTLPGETLFVPMDAPLLRDEDLEDGLYWAATAASSGWRGASIKRSSDAGLTFTTISDVAVRNPLGLVTGVLSAGPSSVFDKTTTLTVTLTSSTNTLESLSELLVLNGNNAAWVGPITGGAGEVIQFTTATLIAENTYELTTLLRGRLGTEHAIATHVAGEYFVLLQGGTLGSSSFGVGDWDKARIYKPVSLLTDELQAVEQTFTNTGIRSKPLSPSRVKGARNGSNDLTVTWLRRSRKRQLGFGNGSPPLGEAVEQYEVDIMSGATVVRTIEVTSETASYTAAEQTTDGLTPGDNVDVKVYQISETRGRGYAEEATI